MFPLIAIISLSIILLGACRHVFRTRRRTTVAAIQALLEPRNTGDAADILSRIYPHGHLALTRSSDILNPTSHDNFVAEARKLIAPANPQQHAEGAGAGMGVAQANPQPYPWGNFAKCAERCTEKFLPTEGVNFVAFIQSITLCTILVRFYDVDPAIPSPLDIAFMTHALYHHSNRSSLLDARELSDMTKIIERWVKGVRASQALETIFPAYESMWRLVAITLDYATRDVNRRNAFLDLSENPTDRQFRAVKVKGREPSVEAIMKEVLRFHPPMCHIMRKSRHPWWMGLFYSPQEVADITSAHRSSAYGEHPEIFHAMRFHITQPMDRLLAFGHGGLRCIAEEWAPMATALIVAKVIDRVDDTKFIIAGNTSNMSVDHNIESRWEGWVIRKREMAHSLSSGV